jgi:cation diffusion facilitator CzcD-associated flavoprotein CzcO
MQIPVNAIDVTVIGGGLAGMAASIHLSKAGLRVLCIESLTRPIPVQLASRWTGLRLPC